MNVLEMQVVAAARDLGDRAYGVTIADHIAEETGKRPSFGSLYAAIDSLERQELVETWMGDATAERGFRAKMMVRPTAAATTAPDAPTASERAVGRGKAPGR